MPQDASNYDILVAPLAFPEPSSTGPETDCEELKTMMRRREGGGLGGRGGGGDGGHQYQMREKLASIGDDFWIEDNAGEKAFKVDGKALRARNTLVLQDKNGQDLYRIQEKMLRIKDTMEIENGAGDTAATIKKAMIGPRDRWKVERPGGEDWEIQGNLLDHEYQIEQGREKVAEVSKKWFRVRDTYGVEIAPGQDDALVLAITAAIDQMAS
jgi:uncharacterized protein YxjI